MWLFQGFSSPQASTWLSLSLVFKNKKGIAKDRRGFSVPVLGAEATLWLFHFSSGCSSPFPQKTAGDYSFNQKDSSVNRKLLDPSLAKQLGNDSQEFPQLRGTAWSSISCPAFCGSIPKFRVRRSVGVSTDFLCCVPKSGFVSIREF